MMTAEEWADKPTGSNDGRERPADEMDLTALEKPVALCHPETLAAMKAWPHGWRYLDLSGEWVGILFPGWTLGVAYRAKPAPAPNLIERGKREQRVFAQKREAIFWNALVAADDLIRAPDNADLRAAYERAIK